ncbi:GNAT family N-acetyltransferase [Streptomyces sp. NBC_00083]|uniref:GNAT family N-acetyltransferase n=1 Tax=Streptomyces sp. NBC_00083 TaxID=2975647 RepID=UPI0022572E7D|nr:GNAT family N-acetyltransferase [Streptomyces sp. NBC_00083]MCX5382115.1 GNAT family N-acetyltransferase [Streptomyces sp. NBC_00083]
MEPVTLTSERLLLRPLGPQDIDAVHEGAQDPAVQRWTTIPSPYARSDAETFAGEIAPQAWKSGTEYSFAVLPRDGGPLLAVTGVMARGSGTAEIGFWAVAEHRGRGYVTEAVVRLARWAFTEAGIDRLEWRAEVGNTGSRAVAERAGFTLEGTLRAGSVNKGTRRDTWIGALLPSDLGLPSVLPHLPARD